MLAAIGYALFEPTREFISSAVFSHISFFLLEIITLAPWIAHCVAIDLPIPLDEPVIRTDLFFKLNNDIFVY